MAAVSRVNVGRLTPLSFNDRSVRGLRGGREDASAPVDKTRLPVGRVSGGHVTRVL